MTSFFGIYASERRTVLSKKKVYRIVEASLSTLNIFAVKKIWLDLEKYVEWHMKDFV